MTSNAEARQALAAMVINEDAAFERLLLEDLTCLYQAKTSAKSWEKEVKRYDPDAANRGAMGLVRAWLYDHPGETLTDPETNVYARLLSAGTETIFDKPSAIKERSPELYRRLEELGLFKLDAAAVTKAIRDSLLSPGDLEGYVKEVPRTLKLDVDKRALE